MVLNRMKYERLNKARTVWEALLCFSAPAETRSGCELKVHTVGTIEQVGESPPATHVLRMACHLTSVPGTGPVPSPGRRGGEGVVMLSPRSHRLNRSSEKKDTNHCLECAITALRRHL